MDLHDGDACYRAVKSRDPRWDGVFYTGVTTTGIYCRPSCPAVTPRRDNVRFYPSAAAAQTAGFRACKRCRPDATPGSPEWDTVGDVTGRAMRLIADGVVEREGVGGLADRLGYTSRHLGRLLGDRVGAGPLALARSRRAVSARILIETTTMPFTDIAFAAGFSSVRQFNDTVREVYASTPTRLRANATGSGPPNPTGTAPGQTGAGGSDPAHQADPGQPTTIQIRLPVRDPFAAVPLLDFLAARAVPGVETVEDGTYFRSLRLPGGPAVVALTPGRAGTTGAGRPVVGCRLHLTDPRDLTAAVERTRRLVDGDADPVAVDTELGADPALAPLVAATPGLRVPGHPDGAELALRAVVGQQVSVAAARGVLGRLTTDHGKPLPPPLRLHPAISHLFPTPDVVAGVPPDTLPMPRARGRALGALASTLASGQIRLDRGRDRAVTIEQLLSLPGIGPWTAGYIAMRALGDPDVFLPGDLVVRRSLGRLDPGPDRTPTAREATGRDQRWRPWRSYAVMHLWHAAP
ncbi:MAG: DNA-3-methyladenine glycosylase 2 family protein [Acidimicrobiales bacterium]